MLISNKAALIVIQGNWRPTMVRNSRIYDSKSGSPGDVPYEARTYVNALATSQLVPINISALN